jgi:hypothetical protein
VSENYRLAIADKEALQVHFGQLSISNWVNPLTGKSGSEHYSGYSGLVIHGGSYVLARYRWGFQNFMFPNELLVNAASESVAKKRTFAKAFRESRCLVPATGFYDHRGSDPVGKRRRYLFETPDEFIAFAGLWREGRVRMYALLTCEPNEVVSEYHHRYPAEEGVRRLARPGIDGGGTSRVARALGGEDDCYRGAEAKGRRSRGDGGPAGRETDEG